MSTGSPQGRVPSPLLYTLLSDDCVENGACPHQHHHSVVRQPHCSGQEDRFQEEPSHRSRTFSPPGSEEGPQHHQRHRLFTLLPPDRRCRSFYPQDIRLLKTTTTSFSNTSHGPYKIILHRSPLGKVSGNKRTLNRDKKMKTAT